MCGFSQRDMNKKILFLKAFLFRTIVLLVVQVTVLLYSKVNKSMCLLEFVVFTAVQYLYQYLLCYYRQNGTVKSRQSTSNTSVRVVNLSFLRVYGGSTYIPSGVVWYCKKSPKNQYYFGSTISTTLELLRAIITFWNTTSSTAYYWHYRYYIWRVLCSCPGSRTNTGGHSTGRPVIYTTSILLYWDRRSKLLYTNPFSRKLSNCTNTSTVFVPQDRITVTVMIYSHTYCTCGRDRLLCTCTGSSSSSI